MSSGNFQKAFLNNFTIFINSKRNQDNPSSLPNMSKGKSGASKTRWDSTTLGNTGVEIG